MTRRGWVAWILVVFLTACGGNGDAPPSDDGAGTDGPPTGGGGGGTGGGGGGGGGSGCTPGTLSYVGHDPLGVSGDPQPFAMEAAGTVVYAGTIEGVYVIDVTTPSAPAQVDFVATPSSAHALALFGDTLYVGYHAGGYDSVIRAYDVGTPTDPQLLGDTSSAIFGIRDLQRVGTRLYGAEGLVIYDVASASSMSEIGFFPTFFATYGLHVTTDGLHAYVARPHPDAGLTVYNVSNPDDIIEIRNVVAPGTVNILETAERVAGHGNHVYVACMAGGLAILDITNRESPAASVFDPGALDVRDVHVADGRLFLACADGVRMYDLSTPSSPTLLAFGAKPPPPANESWWPGPVLRVAAAGNTVYLGTRYGGLLVYTYCP